jgi:hypothetical protein
VWKLPGKETPMQLPPRIFRVSHTPSSRTPLPLLRLQGPRHSLSTDSQRSQQQQGVILLLSSQKRSYRKLFFVAVRCE